MTRRHLCSTTTRVYLSSCRHALASLVRPISRRRSSRVDREHRPHLWEATTSRPSLRDRVAIERHNRLVLERQLADFQPDVVSVWHMVAISMSLIRQHVEADIPRVYVVCDNGLLYGEQ